MSFTLITSKCGEDKYKYNSNILDARLIQYFNNFFRTQSLIMPIQQTKLLNLNKIRISRIIISGGLDLKSKKSNDISRLRLEKFLIKYAIKKNIPLLGICSGMQVICDFYNIKISKLKKHVGKKHKIILNNKKNITRNSYHNYGVLKKDLKSNFTILGLANDSSVEAFKSKKNKIFATMWHPERQGFELFKQDMKFLNFK